MMHFIPRENFWRALLVVSGVLAIGLGLTVGQARTPSATAVRPSPSSSAPKLRVSRPSAAPAEPPAAAGPAAATPPRQPSMEQTSASLSKASVCRGELNFVNVRVAGSEALAPNQTAYVRIAGQGAALQGTQVPFRLGASQEGAIRVAIETDGVISGELELEPPAVKDCEAPPGIDVAVRQEPGSMDRPTFVVERVGADAAGVLLGTHTFEWDFGDGETAESNGPRVQHGYESRSQKSRYSHYLVRVAARDGAGRRLEGAASLVLSNPAFRDLDRDGRVRLMVSIVEDIATDPPTSSFRLYHGYDQEVSIESVSMVETKYAGGGAAPVRAKAVDLSPREALGFTRVAVGEVRQLDNLHALAANRPGVIRRLYLKGRASDGRPVFGRISLAPNEQALE